MEVVIAVLCAMEDEDVNHLFANKNRGGFFNKLDVILMQEEV